MVCLLAVVLLGSVAGPAQATFSAKAWRLELLHRINHYRSAHGVHRLKLGPHETFREAHLQFARISKAGDLDQD